ncbi:uncharacterized protein WM294_003316 isoform 2-T2 [Sarcoramphus papa]
MKMCKTIPMFILLFTGYLCNNMDVAANTTISSHSFSPASKVMQAPDSETTRHGSNHVGEEHQSALLVAGISISFVFLCILVIIGVWYSRKKSKGSSAEINSVPSGEPGVSLKNFATPENQCTSTTEQIDV